MHDLLARFGLDKHPRIITDPRGDETPEKDGVVVSFNPATGEPIAGVRLDTPEDYEQVTRKAVAAFDRWRRVPAPKRGEVVRRIGNAYRDVLHDLGSLLSLEMGKIRAEGIGEVQETIDIADFAVGQSRMLYGKTMPSERPLHAMKEQWLPLGPVGVITAFNFPNAVWGWNAMLAAVCGDVCVWKPSLLTPLITLATNEIAQRIASEMGHEDIFQVVIGTDDVVGERMIADRRYPLISATGSCRMGRRVGSVVAQRLGRCLLELGGNNAVIVEPDADLDLALKSTVFGAVGTCGQRCTTSRRLYLHESIADEFVTRLASAYQTIRIGDPLSDGTLVGPLITESAVQSFERAVAAAREQGGTIVAGGSRLDPSHLPANLRAGHFVSPTVIRAPRNNHLPIAMEETFAPILYVFTYRDLDEAIAMQNSVDQGLSSAIFTGSSRSAERFLDPAGTGSDCGLAYVNLGTSGAEIGGAFGGEKDTGGGRESGSDSWKAYMRRQTCTINFGETFALAQGIRFE
ncbi:MAG: aldehyde dehydrogenase family protein [Planctomycetota bacterium]|nr:MAG: aldehyde dehydrogenase family protein [Planctomycetota bacterium]